MSRLRCLVVFGTRPEAIKMAPVVRELRRRADRAEAITCATAQHRRMLDQVLEVFGIEPDFDLDLMQPDQSLAGLTAETVRRFDEVLADVRPDVVLVQGDTTTAAVSALAAFYRRIDVGHVEAGLRTGDPRRPFPEEINRRMITPLATWNFAPTRSAVDALTREGVSPSRIHLTGNTVIDALLEVTGRPERPGDAPPYPSDERRLVLVTAHRRESFGKPFEDLCTALASIARRRPDVEVVYPVHLNPHVQAPVRRILDGLDRVHLLEPLGYVAFCRLMARATLILTDSGGVQEEAPALGVPVLVMREETERPEAVEAGVARLVGTDTDAIVRESEAILDTARDGAPSLPRVSPFGDGHAAERIVGVLVDGASFSNRA